MDGRMKQRPMKSAGTLVPDHMIPGQVVPDIARWVAEQSVLMTDAESPFSARFTEGDRRITLILGDNASGKSLVFRLIGQMANRHGILPATVSIRERSGAGSSGMEGMRRMFMFGDEAEQSTGATSLQAVLDGLSSLERDKPSILGLDEPEMGLSDGYARALGEMIGMRATTPPVSSCGIVVVTHSRSLVAGLRKGLDADPGIVWTSGEHASLDEWIANPDERTVRELLDLKDLGVERWRSLQSLMRSRN